MNEVRLVAWCDRPDDPWWEEVPAWERYSVMRSAAFRAAAREVAFGTFGGVRPSWLDEDRHVAMIEHDLDSGRLRLLRRVRPMIAGGLGYAAPKSPIEEVPWDADPPPVEPTSPPTPSVPLTPEHFVEIVVVDAQERPIGSRPYELTLPDGSTRTGTLPPDGRIRVDGIVDAGHCVLHLPTADELEWKPADA